MENFDMTQTLPSGLSPMITAGGIILLSVFIVFIIVAIKRWHGRWMPVLLGVVAYLIFTFVFTNMFLSVLTLAPGIDNVFSNNPVTYPIVYYIIATVGFTIARLIVGYMLKDRFEREGDVYMAGIGLGAGDSFLYGITSVSYLTWCTAINSSGMEATLNDALNGVSQDAVSQTLEMVSTLITSQPVLWLLLGISCVLDVVLGIVLMNAVFGAVKNDLPKWVIGVTMAAHFINAISFQLYDAQSMNSILIWFGIKLIIFAGLVYYIWNMCKGKINYDESK